MLVVLLSLYVPSALSLHSQRKLIDILFEQDFTGENLEVLIKKLVEIDSKWIPTDPGTSLYIRPTMIGTQAGLGVGASTDVLLFVMRVRFTKIGENPKS